MCYFVLSRISYVSMHWHFWVIFYWIRVGFFKLSRFFLTTCDSHETLHLALGLVDMPSVVVSMWAMTKFSYSSFRVCLSDVALSVSNFFLPVVLYLLLIFLLVSEHQSSSIVCKENIFIYIYIYIYIYIRVCMRASESVFVGVYVCTCVRMSICSCGGMLAPMDSCLKTSN